MRTGGGLALTVREACIAAGLTFCLGFAHAQGDVRVVINDDAVTIKADNTSVRSVLEELSRQASLIVMSQESLDELVTLDIDQRTLPAAIRHLLRHKSFMLHQPRPVSIGEPHDTTPYSKIWIFSEESDGSQNTWMTQFTARQYPAANSEMIDYQILASSDRGRDREEAMYGFGEIGSGGGIEYLQEGLSDPEERVREAAIESLADLGGTESVKALSIALNDPEASVRVDAVDALGEIGGKDTLKLLQGAMADENHMVREAAAEWLTELAWMHD